MRIRTLTMLLLLAASPLSYSGDAETDFQQGRAYLRGEGVPKDVDKAFALMKSAAEQGHADAMSGVGYFYDNGVSVAKDAKLAAEWFRKGAEKGSPKACLNLGKSILAGKEEDSKEGDPETKEAIQWITKAATSGLPEAAFTYGRILYSGIYGVSRDYKAAMPYLKTAAESGIADAQNMLGSMFECGSGTTIDEKEAETWYRKAALQGHPRAQANLGNILGPLNEDHEKRIEALAWLLMAKAKDDVIAKKTLTQTTFGLKPGDLPEAEKKLVQLTKQVKP